MSNNGNNAQAKGDQPQKVGRFCFAHYQKGEVVHERRIGKAETQTVCCGAQADRSQAQGKAIAERAETADQKRENPSALHPCRNVGDLFERANPPDR